MDAHHAGLEALEAGEIDAYFADQSILQFLRSDAKDPRSIGVEIAHIGAYPAYYVPITQHRSVLADEARFLGSRNTSWGQAIARTGAAAFYSTAWENTASRAVAAKLGLTPVGEDLGLF